MSGDEGVSWGSLAVEGADGEWALDTSLQWEGQGGSVIMGAVNLGPPGFDSDPVESWGTFPGGLEQSDVTLVLSVGEAEETTDTDTSTPGSTGGTTQTTDTGGGSDGGSSGGGGSGGEERPPKPSDSEDDEGCGCGMTAAASGGWLPLLGLMVVACRRGEDRG